MVDIQELKQKASDLRKDDQYEEALPLYKTLWEDHRDQCNEWDGWGFAQSLRKLGRSAEALDVCREVYKIRKDFSHNINLYAWCIYDLEIKKDTEDIKKQPDQFFDAAEAILKMVEQDHYSPYTRTVFAVVDYLKDPPSYPADKIITWLEKLNPSQLSPEHVVWEDGDTYPSEKETWAANMCKALFKTDHFNECIETGHQALREITKFHYDNDIWVRRNIARSKYALGEVEDAIQLYQKIMERKRDWFIKKEMGECYFALEDFDNAWKMYVEAALEPGDLGFKWELFLRMGELLKNQEKTEYTKDVISLAMKVRQDQDWDIPDELQAIAADLKIQKLPKIDLEKLYGELMKTWKKEKYSQLPEMTGWVSNFLPSGQDGFISGDNGQDYYFKVNSFQGKSNELKEDSRVEFHIVENPNPKQNDNAVNIRIKELDESEAIQGMVKNFHNSYGFIEGDDGNDYYFEPESYNGNRDHLSRGLMVKFYVKKNNRPDQKDNALLISKI